MLHEVERIAPLHAQELAVDAAAIAIVAADNLIVANAQRRAAAVAAMRANRADVLHLPRTRLIAIGSAGERAHRADVDAGAALVAFQMIAHIRHDLGDHTAIGDAQRSHAHAFVAGAHAAVTKNAARRVEKHNGRPLLLVDVNLAFHKAAFAGSVAEHHVLQFALAAFVAHGTIQRVIRQQKFQRTLASLLHQVAFGVDHHAFADRQRATNLKLRSLFHFHQAHAARGLQRIAFVIAEGGNFDAVLAGGLN